VLSANQVYSAGNGSTTNNGDGLFVRGSGPATTVTIKNSTFMGNFGNGIEIYLTDGNPNISSNTINFGNDLNADGDLDLYIH